MRVSLRRSGSVLCAVACGVWFAVLPHDSSARAPREPAARPAAARSAVVRPAAGAAVARRVVVRFVGGKPAAKVAARPAARQTGAIVPSRARQAVAAKAARGTALKAAAAGGRGSARTARSERADAAAQARSSHHGLRALRASFAPSPVPAPPSVGQAIGLKATDDPLDLRSSVALVVDQDTGETLFDKNARAVLPIASITKLMTALVTVEARLPGDELIEISYDDVDTEKNSRSRLAVGAQLTRTELLQLALMASENRAAHALGRTYPGGLGAFVAAMNARARSLGMTDTFYLDPTGLSSQNQSNARDLVRLLQVAYGHALIRQFSTATELTVDTGRRPTTFRNTNRLTHDATWDIGLQKTGFINEAGNCMVMQARIDGRGVWLVLLDAQGRSQRVADANRLRRWISEEGHKPELAVRERTAA